MTAFNRSFYDLNHERRLCVDGAAGFPAELISDLKVSLPGYEEDAWLESLYISGETVRLTLTAVSGQGRKLIAMFSSNQRSMIRTGETYDLNSVGEGYGGLIVFGEGLRKDWQISNPFRISEECCTRYQSSAVPYVGLVCDNTKLTGEILLGSGDPTRLTSNLTELNRLEHSFLIANQAICLSLTDTGQVETVNPMVAMANGINSYFGLEGRRGPIFKIFGALPDESGTIYLRFDEHFHLAGITETLSSIPKFLNGVAIGSNLSQEDICHLLQEVPDSDESGEQPCSPSGIRFEVIRYE